MAPLVRLVGPDVALEILLEGRDLRRRPRRRRSGLVTRVVPDAEVAAEAHATAQRIAEGAPLVARWHKKFARRLADPRPITAAEHDECFDCFDTEDFRIGYAAFLAKRKPGVRRAMRHGRDAADRRTRTRARSPACACSSSRRSWRARRAAMMLADMGADVIKVEKLPGGDDARGYREPRVNGVSAPFLMMNRNKRGIALDLKHRAGREILMRLVRDADVLIENYRRGTMEKLGLGYDVLAADQSRRSSTARSRATAATDPCADKGGFDLIAQGFAGLMAITGEAGRARRSRPAIRSPTSTPAFSPRWASLAAYAHKLKTGRGPARRHVALRSRAAADLLARGELFRDRRHRPARSAPRTS